MSFDRRSVGNFCRFMQLLGLGSGYMLVLIGLGACSVITKDREKPPETTEEIQAAEQKLSAEVSLSGDTKSIEDMRKDIPEPKKSDNELLKQTLGLMGEVKEPPQRHRDRFTKLMRKIRNDHTKKDRKEREQFRKKEQKDRDAFLKKLKDDRDSFNRSKSARDVRKEFYDEQDEKRKEFFADQKDARKEFESKTKADNSDFNAFVKERNDEFNRELKIYTQKYNDLQKQKREQEKLRRQSQSQRAQQPPKDTKVYEQLKTEE